MDDELIAIDKDFDYEGEEKEEEQQKEELIIK